MRFQKRISTNTLHEVNDIIIGGRAKKVLVRIKGPKSQSSIKPFV